MADPQSFDVIGVLAREGSATGDDRKIDTEALKWTMPQPLRWVREDFGAHNGAVVVGAIEKIERTPSGDLAYSGKLFDTEQGRQCRDEMYTRYASSGLKFGISVDLDSVVIEDEGDTMVVKEAMLRGATLCDIPAYATAYTMLTEQVPAALVAAALLQKEGFLAISAYLFDRAGDAGLLSETGVRADGVVLYDLKAGALVAAAPRQGAPVTWFSDPGLRELTPMTVTEDGRIYGHAASWRQCHTGYGDVCIRAPRSRTNYAYFRTGVVLADDGTQVPVGHITMGTGHAGPRMSAGPAADHYDNTGSIVCDVVAGEDAHGMWLAGAVRDGVTDAQIAELRSTAPSGDWRTIDGNLELVAMLNVVSPGFPVPRVRALVASGEVTSLVASATFETEAVVEQENTEMAPEAVLEAVAPEAVAPEVVDEAPVVEDEALADTNVEDQPDAQDAEPVSDEEVEVVYDAKAEIAEMREMLTQALAEIAALKAPLVETSDDEAPAEDQEPVEPAPAVEHSQEDLLKALDLLVNGQNSAAALLAELDAKVG